MLETNEQINLENKNPISMLESPNNDLNQNLISTSMEDNNKTNIIDIENDKSDDNINKNEDKGRLQSYENLNINEIEKKTIENNNVNNLKDNNLDEYSHQINKNEQTDNIFRFSKINRQSFQKIIKNDGSINDNNLNLTKNKILLKKFLVLLKYVFGFFLTSGSVILLIIIIRDKITQQKLIGIIIEPLIILISLLGMFLYKNIIYKKIIFALFLWEGTYLFPLSYYVKTSIKEEYIFYYDMILKIRIGLFFGQLINFIMSLAFKLEI
jgi:hypothetical protein